MWSAARGAGMVLWTSPLVLAVACSASGGRQDQGSDERVALRSEAVEDAPVNANWSWTFDDLPGWSWKVSWSYEYRRWIWGYCHGCGTNDYGWRWCWAPRLGVPDTIDTDIPIRLSAPRPTGDPPADPPPGAPTGPPPEGGPTEPPWIIP